MLARPTVRSMLRFSIGDAGNGFIHFIPRNNPNNRAIPMISKRTIVAECQSSQFQRRLFGAALAVIAVLATPHPALAQLSQWNPLGSGMNDTVRAMTIFNNELIAGGDFTTAGGVPASRLARWNGTTWQALGGGVNAPVRALMVYNGELIVA